jgi:hypothetical protein
MYSEFVKDQELKSLIDEYRIPVSVKVHALGFME